MSRREDLLERAVVRHLARVEEMAHAVAEGEPWPDDACEFCIAVKDLIRALRNRRRPAMGKSSSSVRGAPFVGVEPRGRLQRVRFEVDLTPSDVKALVTDLTSRASIQEAYNARGHRAKLLGVVAGLAREVLGAPAPRGDETVVDGIPSPFGRRR